MTAINKLNGQIAKLRAQASSVKAKLTLLQKNRDAARRKAIVAWARWGALHEPQIHYKEIRPYPLSVKLPLTTDCSGFATFCYFHAGAPDPNGFHYDGAGYTGTLVKHGTKIKATACLPGDLIVYGTDHNPNGDHVVVAIQAGANPMTVSHGQEKGPQMVRHAVEAASHRSGCVFLRFPMS